MRLTSKAIVIQKDTKSLGCGRWDGHLLRKRIPWVEKLAWTLQIDLASKGQSPQDLPHLNVLARVTLGRQTPNGWTIELPGSPRMAAVLQSISCVWNSSREVSRRREKLELC